VSWSGSFFSFSIKIYAKEGKTQRIRRRNERKRVARKE